MTSEEFSNPSKEVVDRYAERAGDVGPGGILPDPTGKELDEYIATLQAQVRGSMPEATTSVGRELEGENYTERLIRETIKRFKDEGYALVSDGPEWAHGAMLPPSSKVEMRVFGKRKLVFRKDIESL